MTEEILKKNRPSRILRGIALTLMIITVLLTIIGAVGTVCIAIGAENYKGMEALVPYKWLYKIFVIIKFIVGFWGIQVVYTLFKGREKAYRNSLIVLIIGLLVAAAQMTTSHFLRGSTMPVDMRFYVTLVTLIVFLIIRIPSIWPKVDFTWSKKNNGSKTTVAGTAMIISGIITVTTPIWASPSHITPEGYNLVNEIAGPLLYGGLSLIILGIAALLYSVIILHKKEIELFTNRKEHISIKS